jgi:hypothetical protein
LRGCSMGMITPRWQNVEIILHIQNNIYLCSGNFCRKKTCFSRQNYSNKKYGKY